MMMQQHWCSAAVGPTARLGCAVASRLFLLSKSASSLAGPAHRLTICLDLDLCLVHTDLASSSALVAGDRSSRLERGEGVPERAPDFEFATSATGTVRVWQRPGLAQFLQQCAGLGEVVVFTSSVEEYARAIVAGIDPGRLVIARVLSRRHCTQLAPGLFAKDLDALGTPLARTVLVDDLLASFSLQPDNGIPIRPYHGAPHDLALDGLLPLLRALECAHDVRSSLACRFSLRATLERKASQHTAPPASACDSVVDRVMEFPI